MKELKEMIKEFLDNYNNAPLYGGYSRTLKRKIESRQQVKNAFIDSLQMLSVVTEDQAVKDHIDVVLKRFETM